MKDFILNLDRPRRLIFDFDAWDLITDKYNAKTDEGDFDFSKLKISTKEMPFLVFAGMRWEDPELTEQKTRLLLNQAIQSGAYTILSILGPVSEAIFAQSGLANVSAKVDEGEKKEAGPAAAVPGSKEKES